MKRLLLFAGLIIGIYSCSYENELIPIDSILPKAKPLEIITRTLTSQSTNFVQIFREGSEIGLHISTGEVNNLYKNTEEYKNVKAQACIQQGKIRWKQYPEVSLQMEQALVYAYYPYIPDADFDATRIPIKIHPDASLTCNYMYGSQAIGQKNVSSISPVAWLNMNYALSLIEFQISQSADSKEAFVLSKVQLGNKTGGTTLNSSGTMHIATGAITGIPGAHAATQLTLSTPILLETAFSAPVSMKVIPTTNGIKEGDVEALFIINNTTYTYHIPSCSGWKKGSKYIYKLVFNGQSLQLSDITTKDWNPSK